MSDKKRVLILCTGNSARSQMAEGLLRSFGGDRFQVWSAGTQPSIVRPEAIAVMLELGIDISSHRSKHVREFDSQHFDSVVTDRITRTRAVPSFPSTRSAYIGGSETERLAAFRRVRDALAERFREFIDPRGVVSESHQPFS